MSLVQFGCWNEGYCDIDNITNGMSAVMNTLIKDFETPTFYIVSGDNYYPYKRTKEEVPRKIFNSVNLFSGFECAKMLAKKAPIYMLMGNHDLKPEKNMVSPTGIEVPVCSIIESEMNYATEFNFDRYCAILGENTICLFINTVLYTDDRDEVYECMVEYRKEYKDRKTIDAIAKFDEMVLEELLDILINTYNYNFQNIVISGHDPIVTRREKPVKIKNGKKKGGPKITPLFKEGLDLLNKLYNKLPGANKYYLCADTHQYQKALIKLGGHEVTQYVVGTGGTECDFDDIKLDNNYVDIETPFEEVLQYKLEEVDKSFGFLHGASDANNNLVFEFHPVEPCDAFLASGGGKRRTRRSKRKIKKTRRNNRKY